MGLTATLNRLFQGEITTTNLTSYFTVTDSRVIVRHMMICNLSSNKRAYVSLAIVPNGETLSNKHYILNNLELFKSEKFDCRLVLMENDSIYFSSDSLVSVYMSSANFNEVI